MTEHTPSPWVQFAIDGKCDAIMPAGRDGDICTFRQAPSDADAAFIVKAVNNHDLLVAQLHRLAIFCCDDLALALVDALTAPVGREQGPTPSAPDVSAPARRPPE